MRLDTLGLLEFLLFFFEYFSRRDNIAVETMACDIYASVIHPKKKPDVTPQFSRSLSFTLRARKNYSNGDFVEHA